MTDKNTMIFLGIGALALLLLFTGHLKMGGFVSLQAVIGTDCPNLKAKSSNYQDMTNWVATDCNNDGDYEGYGFSQYSMISSSGFTIKKTPEGTDYFCRLYNGAYLVYLTIPVAPGGYTQVLYKNTTGAFAQADLTCAATCTPNWQCSEWGVCSAGAQIRACADANNCGTMDGQPTLSQTCSASVAYICDSDSDGTINRDELGNVISKWIGGI